MQIKGKEEDKKSIPNVVCWARERDSMAIGLPFAEPVSGGRYHGRSTEAMGGTRPLMHPGKTDGGAVI
jgi:hypothetical protein